MSSVLTVPAQNTKLPVVSTNVYDVIIIGLGAAGAAAASSLANKGKRVLALEAEDRIGGRVFTVPFGDGTVELGGEWIHGEKDNTVYEEAVKNNVPLLSQGVDLITYRSDGSKPETEIQELINTLVQEQQCDELVLPEEQGSFGKFVAKHIKETIKAKKPELLTDDDFMEQLHDFMNLLVNNHNASFDWSDVDLHDKYTPLEGHLYLSWNKYGYKTYFDIILNNHNNGPGLPTLDIQLNKEVIEIEWSQKSSEKVVVICHDETVYKADSVIVTVSLGVLKERHTNFFKPNLPPEKQKAIERISMGVMDKIQLAFDEIWWPMDTPFIGFLWKGEDKKEVPKEDFWITRIFAASRPAGSNNVLTLWTSGETAKIVEQLSENEVKKKCRELLQKFLGVNITVPLPSAILRSYWYSNPFTRGSYSYDSVACAPFPTSRSDLAAPILDTSGKPRILFAGEATHDTHFSTVHGAAETGYREAERILKISA